MQAALLPKCTVPSCLLPLLLNSIIELTFILNMPLLIRPYFRSAPGCPRPPPWSKATSAPGACT